jgi:hypothetical protein
MACSLPIKLAQIGCGLDFGNPSAGFGNYFIEAGWHVELKVIIREGFWTVCQGFVKTSLTDAELGRLRSTYCYL